MLLGTAGSDEEDYFDDCSPIGLAGSSFLTAVEEPPTTLYWVRMSALRIHDNRAFSTAFSDKSRRFRAVFVIDPWYSCVDGKQKIGLNRCVMTVIFC